MVLCWQGWCMGQQAFTASGIDVSGINGSMSVTIGQINYGVMSDGNVILIAGVQQPFETPVETATDPLPNATMDFTLFPNPSTRMVILKLIGQKSGDLSYRLVDSEGKELEKAPLLQTETFISLDSYKASIYFLIVMDITHNLKIFKIIKN